MSTFTSVTDSYSYKYNDSCFKFLKNLSVIAGVSLKLRCQFPRLHCCESRCNLLINTDKSDVSNCVCSNSSLDKSPWFASLACSAWLVYDWLYIPFCSVIWLSCDTHKTDIGYGFDRFHSLALWRIYPSLLVDNKILIGRLKTAHIAVWSWCQGDPFRLTLFFRKSFYCRPDFFQPVYLNG